MQKRKTYIAIDLKSFYASVECVARNLDPITTNLVVADESRTEKTICLAVSPSLKAYGIPGRARLFEVIQRIAEVNSIRKLNAPGKILTGKSTDGTELAEDKSKELDFIIAKPRMAKYMETSASIYQIYLKYIAPEDIHVYSIDEVFIDATPYLRIYNLDGRGFASMLIREIISTTGITATAGIGTNLFLCKVAMDIMAKHVAPDANGVRIAELDEHSFREQLWDHRPLTDFWRVGHGIAAKLEHNGMYTLGDVARCSLGKPGEFHNQNLLYKLFGVNAELLIDHAWGVEPCTIADIKAYRPQDQSVSSGQVLSCAYSFQKARLIVKEMAELLALDLVEKGLVTNQVTLTIGYDVESLTDPKIRAKYKGPVVKDHYGRAVPKHSHGTANLHRKVSSSRMLSEAFLEIYDRAVNPDLLMRRVTLCANSLTKTEDTDNSAEYEQIDLFSDPVQHRQEDAILERERRQQEAMLKIKRRFGKSAILKGMNLEDGATTIDRNSQIGGHKA